jgi:hypothetical protein
MKEREKKKKGERNERNEGKERKHERKEREHLQVRGSVGALRGIRKRALLVVLRGSGGGKPGQWAEAAEVVVVRARVHIRRLRLHGGALVEEGGGRHGRVREG